MDKWEPMIFDGHVIIRNCAFCVVSFYATYKCTNFACFSKIEKRATLNNGEFIRNSLKKRRF